jgi:tetratricopeptide (TPR) repeat protein
MNKSPMTRKFLLFLTVSILIVCMQYPVMGQTEKGMELFNALEFKNAEDAFRNVFTNDPENIEAGYYLGMSLLMQGEYEKAANVFEKLKASGKTNRLNKGQLEIALTHIYLELDKYSEALKSLDAAKNAQANPADIHTFQGAYYLEKDNDAQRGLEELEKAIEMAPENAYAYYYSGYAQVRLGHPAKAVQLFRRFLELAPYAPEAEKAKILIDALC